MLSSTSHREALVACPPFSPWNLPIFTVESTLSSSYSRSDPPLSHQGAAPAHLVSLLPHDLVIWTDGSVPFPRGKASSGVPANGSRCGTEATISFSPGQYVQVFPLNPAPFCMLFAGLSSTNKSATSLLFSSYRTLVLSLPTHSILSSIFPFTSNSLVDLAGTVFFFLFYQAIMGSRTLVFPREQCG